MDDSLNITQREALRALQRARRPLSAYEVLAVLRARNLSGAAPTAYRALAKLIALGLAHRLESLNAYVACCAEHRGGEPAFSICNDCGTVCELADAALSEGVVAATSAGGFVPKKAVIEVHGRCASCEAAS